MECCRSQGARSPRAATVLRVALLAAALCLLAAAGWSAKAEAAGTTIAAVGDMGCSPTDNSYKNGNGTSTRCRQKYVSDVLVDIGPAALLDLGDNQYLTGSLTEYETVYHATFGRLNPVVYPSLGNAEYDTPGAQGFFDYFSNTGVLARIRAGNGDTSNLDPGGYYSFDIGGWHIIALNSNCGEVGGCGPGTPEEVWVRADLAAHPNQCTLAYYHHPRWNSGALGNDVSTNTIFKDLYNAHADVVLSGHGNHHYERTVQVNGIGAADPNGIRQFIVSTGGESHGTPPVVPGNPTTTAVADYTSFGALKMTLQRGRFDWEFVPEVGGDFTDSGTSPCHATTTADAPTGLGASAGNAKVSLSWQAPSDGGSPITGYKIYRGTAAGSGTLLQTVGPVTSYDDLTADNGTKYYYRVAATNSNGESANSNEVSATPTAPPPPPAYPRTGVLDSFARAAGPLGANWQSPGLQDGGTVAIKSSGQTGISGGAATATWNTSFGADQEAFLTVPTLPAANGFIQVAARVSTQNAATVSCYFVRVTPATGAWDLRVKLNGGGSSSLKTFNAPFAAGDGLGMQLTGTTITVFRKAGAAAWSVVGSATDNSITGGGYTSFTLSDTTARGGAFGGGTIPGVVQAPGAPSLSATAGDAKASLSWSAPADGGAPITAYKLYRGTAPGTGSLLQTLGNVTSYDDTTTANGTTYYYRVAAVNSAGEGGQSNEVSATPAAAPPPPTFPRTGVLDGFARAAGGLGVNWQSPGLADGGTVAIKSSGLVGSNAGAASATWNTSFGAEQEAYLTVPTLPLAGGFIQVAGRVTTLDPATVSCYFIRVTPSTGLWDLREKLNGAGSTSLKTFNAPFAAGDSVGLQLSGSTITVLRKPGSGAWAPVGSATDGSITSGGFVSLTLSDTTARGGAFGGGTPAASVQPPAAPALSATAGDAKVSLAWNAPANNGAPITAYKVYRGTAPGAGTLLQTLGTVTSYDDTTAVNGTTYYYRVAAVNSAGDGTQSNEVSATPSAAPPPPAFPHAPVLDNFARAAGALGSNWQSPGLADDGTAAIKSSGLVGSNAGVASATWNSLFVPDQEAYLTVPALGGNGEFLQIAGRVSTQSAVNVSAYFLRLTPSSGTWDLRRKLNGGASTSMKTFTTPFAAGDSAGLQIVGSTITAWRKPAAGAWTAVGSTTDTTITGAGYASFTLQNTTMRATSFGAGPSS